MATEDVVIARFRADVDQLRADFDKYTDELDKAKKAGDDAAKATQAQTKTTLTASQKRTEALKKEQAELKRLETAQKKAFTVKDIKAFDDQIRKTNQNIATLRGTTSSVTQSLKGSFASIGAGIAAAFSIQALSQFTKASIDAFLEAEESANRLKFAITQVGGESEKVFDRLLSQSKELQKVSIFSDESIQSAQTALSNFGLVGAQIELLIPKIVDLAAANKIDLTQATETVIRGIEGQARGLTLLGLKFEDAGTALDNLNIIMEKSGKFFGAAVEQTKTLSGQLEVTKNRANELEESIGSNLAGSWVKLKVGILSVVEALIRYGKLNQTTLEDTRSIGRQAAVETVQRLQEQKKSTDEIITIVGQLIKVRQEENDRIELNRQLRVRNHSLSVAENNALVEQVTLGEGIVEGYQNQLALLTEIQGQNKLVLTQDQLRAASIEELNKSLEENKKGSDIFSRSNVDNINKELEARKKLANQQAKEKEIADFLNTAPPVTALPATQIPVKFDEKQVEQAVNDANIPKTLEGRPVEIPVVVDQGSFLDSFLKANNEIIAASQMTLDSVANLSSVLADRRIQDIEREKEAQIKALDDQQTAIDDQLDKRRISESLASKLSNKLLNDRTAAEKKAADEQRRVKKRAAVLERTAALVRIAIATAINSTEQPGPLGALIPYWVAIGALEAAAVLAQPIPYKKGSKDTGAKGHMAMVGEQGPEVTFMPARSKVLPNDKVNRHGEAIDAMFDNNFEDYVYKKYTLPEIRKQFVHDRLAPEPYNFITPQLEKQKRSHDQRKERSFADNITKSFIYQGIGITAVEMDQIRRKGTQVNNAAEVGKAIAKELMNQVDPYRR